MSPSDDLLDAAPRDTLCAWAVGVISAVAIAVYGAICIWTQSATWVAGDDSSSQVMHSYGASAVGLGITFVAIAGLLHFHFFWSWRPKFHGYAQMGKVLSLLGAAGGIIYFLVRFWLD